jgi:V/A-type H+-transporting ATPase subunit C
LERFQRNKWRLRLGLSDIITELGLDSTMTLALIIIAGAVLITIILLMSYFNILITIASFSYPNARLKAMGNPFVRKKKLSGLIELSGAQEAAMEISKEGYDLPQNIEKVGTLEAERKLEIAQVAFLQKVISSNPQSIRPFLEAHLMKYDAMQIKKALRARQNGASDSDLKMRLIPVKEITQEIVDDILDTSTVDDVCNAVKTTRFGDILIKAASEHKGDIVVLDLTLDKFYSKELQRAITRVDTTVRETVTLYIGKHADITNIKHIIRSKEQGLDPQTTESFLVDGGRLLAPWKLKQMIEVKGLSELITELEGTPYLETLREAMQNYSETKSIYSLEVALDRLLLKTASEIASSAMIFSGPTIKYLVAKEFEVRNLKAVLRGMYEGLPSESIMPMLIWEEGS